LIYALERKTLTSFLRMCARLEMNPDINVLFDLMSGSEKEKTPQLYILRDGEAHISIQGILSRKRSFWAMIFGSAPSLTYDEIALAVGQADADPIVKTIVLDINSPGGSVDGVDVAAQAVKNATKPTEARVDNLAASGAYWIASQANNIMATSPAAAFGSIGVIAELMDDTRAWKEIGVDIVLIGSTDAPAKKAAYQPTTKEGQAVWQKELDDLHAVFAGRVAEGRNVSIEKINSDFGQGGLVIAIDAKKAGMIDRIDGMAEPTEAEPDIEIESEDINAGVAGDTAAKADGKSKTGRGTIMTPTELLKEHPECYAAIEEIGVQKERKRIAKLQAWADSDPVCTEIVAKAIVSGESAEDVMPQLMAAIKKSSQPGEKSLENPPQVHTGQTTTGSGEGDEIDDAKIKATLARLPA